MSVNSKMLNACPVLASLDILTSVEFYEKQLGFKRTFCDEGYAVIVRDQICIHFWKCEDRIFPENTSCYIDVGGVDYLYEEFEKLGVIHPNGHLEEKPWGMKEFAILDVFGNLLRFGERLP